MGSKCLLNNDGSTDCDRLRAEIEELKERVEKWKSWHDNACEDAKKWRRDAQTFFGALQEIAACDECDPEISISLLQLIAREALDKE